jgi:hypothetical protein
MVAVSQGSNEIAIVGLATRREAKAGYLTSFGSRPMSASEDATSSI